MRLLMITWFISISTPLSFPKASAKRFNNKESTSWQKWIIPRPHGSSSNLSLHKCKVALLHYVCTKPTPYLQKLLWWLTYTTWQPLVILKYLNDAITNLLRSQTIWLRTTIHMSVQSHIQVVLPPMILTTNKKFCLCMFSPLLVPPLFKNLN